MKTTEKKVRVGKVKKDKSGEEWIVPVYVDGKFNDDMTYYAGSRKSDKEDAEKTRDRMIKDFKTSKEYELEESNKKEDSIILEQDVVINQKGKKIILEKGDMIEILSNNKIEELFISPSDEAEENMITYHGVDYPILTKDNIKEFLIVLSKDLPSTIVVDFHGKGNSKLTSVLFPKKIVIRGDTIEVFSKDNAISSGYLNIVLSEIVDITSVDFGKTFQLFLQIRSL